MQFQVAPQVLKELSRPSLYSWSWRVLFDWMQVAGVFIFLHYYPSIPAFLAGWMILGIKMNSLALLAHDVAHFSLSRDRALNNFIGYGLLGIPLGQSISGYRVFHFNHHRNQGTKVDPEIQYQSTRARWARPISRKRLIYIFVTDLLGFGLKDILIGLKCYKPENKIEPILTPLFFASMLLLSWKLNVLWMPALWIFTAVTSHWAIFRLRTFTEHAGVDATPRVAPNPVVRFILFPHNTHMHYEHHCYPTVPLWNLPELRRQMTSSQKIHSSRELINSLESIPAFPWERPV